MINLMLKIKINTVKIDINKSVIHDYKVLIFFIKTLIFSKDDKEIMIEKKDKGNKSDDL